MPNDFNIPREQQTFLGMMDNFFNNLAQTAVDKEMEKKKKNKEQDKKSCSDEKSGTSDKEIHVHIHAAKKKDPKAKVRNRGKVVFPAGSKKVKDDKDHFPINDADQARNTLSKVEQYNEAPSWYSGSLNELQTAVRGAVKRAYPDIEVTEPKKKKKK